MKLPKRIEAKNCAAYGECVKKDEQCEIVQEKTCIHLCIIIEVQRSIHKRYKNQIYF